MAALSSTSYSIYHDLLNLTSTYEYTMCWFERISALIFRQWDEIKWSYQIHNGKYIACHILIWPDMRCVGFNSLSLSVAGGESQTAVAYPCKI